MQLADRVQMMEEVVHVVESVDHLVEVAHHLGRMLRKLHARQLTVFGFKFLKFSEQMHDVAILFE